MISFITIFSGNQNTLIFIFAFLISSLGFLLSFFIGKSERIKKFLNFQPGDVRFVMLQRVLGIMFYGIIPLLLIFASGKRDLSAFGVVAPDLQSIIWTGILGVIILPLTYLNSRSQSNLQMYPQIRVNEWSFTILIMSGLSWSFYLLAYEFMFRGLFFFLPLTFFGFWPAFVLNLIIYSLFHLPKGYKETLGTIPFGMILCTLTYKTGSIWVAVFTHIILALSNEWFSLHAHPQMILKNFQK